MRVELCPSCGSGKINRTDVLSLQVQCDSCLWAGKQDQLVSGNIPERPADVALLIAQQYLVSLSKNAAVYIGASMIESGLVPQHTEKTTMGRLVKAAVLGAHKSTLAEIEKIQKEYSNVDNRD